MNLGIVTISYNQANFLAEAIESVKLRDSSQLQYVIVDPGSKDASRDVIEKYKTRFHKKILEPDKGPADGLNKGFAACGDADIYGYLNSDDRFAPGALDWVLEFFEKNPTVDVLLGAVRIVNAKGQARLRKSLSWSFHSRGFMNGTASAVQQATFFRQRAWRLTQGFNAVNKSCWDTELLVDMLLAGAVFEIRHKVLGDFRIHDASITHSVLRRDDSIYHRYLADLSRIRHKIAATGIAPRAPVFATLGRWAFKFNPYRRLLELTVN